MKLRKAVVCILLAAVLPISALAASFSDVSGNSWYSDAVNFCADNGWVSGYNDGTFKPDNTITRAEFAVICSAKLKLEKTAPNHFKDVPDREWFTPYVLKCVQAGIIAGYSSDSFGPGDKVTREQAAVILANVFDIAKSEGRTSFADDNRISSWAVGSVKSMASKGVIAGVGENRFDPASNVTRAAICQMMYRGENPQPDDYNLICERYRAANDLYMHVFLDQEKLDRTDTIKAQGKYGDMTFYHVPQADSKQAFADYCKQFYTAQIVEGLLKENDYVEQNGKLYMSQTLGIGGPVVTKVEMSIRKDSDTRYTVAMTESYEETMTSQSERHLIQVDGSWVWDSIICASDDVSFSKK